LDGALAELAVRKVEPLLGDLDLPAGLVNPAIAKERLRKFDAQARGGLGGWRSEKGLNLRAGLVEGAPHGSRPPWPGVGAFGRPGQGRRCVIWPVPAKWAVFTLRSAPPASSDATGVTLWS